MYNMEVESPLFRGKTLVAQHRMVNEVRLRFFTPNPQGSTQSVLIDRSSHPSFSLRQVLAEEIAEMHGLSLKTRPSKE